MKQFLVIGIGRFGSALAMRLYKMGHEVLVIDTDEELIQDISDKVTHAVTADATDEDVLKSLGVRNFDVGIVAIGGDIQSSIIATLMLKEMGLKYVVAKAQNEIHAKVLKKIGADRVVFPERDMGVRVAQNLITTNIFDIIELSPDYGIFELEAPSSWLGKNLKTLNLRTKYGVNIMAIKNDKEKVSINFSPRAEDIIKQGDILIVVGSNQDLIRLGKRVD